MKQLETQPNKKAVNSLSIAHFVIDNYSAFSSPILPLLVAKLDINLAIMTSILSVGHLMSSLCQPIFGFIADRWRKRFFIVFGMLLGAIFHSMVGIAPNLISLVLCVALGSLGIGFFHPQATGMMILFSDKKNAIKEMGLFLACGTLGYSIGPLVSSSIANFIGLEFLPFASIVGIICAILILKFVPKVSNIPIQDDKPKFWESVKVITKDRIIQILIMISAFKSMVSIMFSVFLPFVWTKQGFSTFQIGIIIFIFLCFSAAGTYSSQIFEKRIGTTRTFALSMMSTLPLCILYFTTSKSCPILSLIFFFLIGYFAMLSVSINMVLAQKHLPQYKSIIAGFIGGFSWGLVGITLGLMGYIAQIIGVEKLLMSLSLLPFLCAYFLRYLPKNSDE
ncbi:MFS transporter [bacterium]|nr:MFS transporter [bacterium]